MRPEANGSGPGAGGAAPPDAGSDAVALLLRARVWLIPLALLLAIGLLAGAPLVAAVTSLGGQPSLLPPQSLRLVCAGVLLLGVAVLALAGGTRRSVLSTSNLVRAQALGRQAIAQAGGVRLTMLRQAAELYRAAVEEYTRSGERRLWASATNGLGVALRQLSESAAGFERVRLAAEATACFRAAAEAFAGVGDQGNWAIAQNNLGAALSSQATAAEGAERARLLAEAVAAYQQALRVSSGRGDLAHWADAMSNLGAALGKQAEMADGAERVRLLRMSVDAHRAVAEAPGALQERVRMTAENNMGASLMRLALCVEGEERLRLLAAGVGAYRQSLGTDRRERFPTDWSRTQHNLAGALTHWAEAAGGPEQALLASEAVNACQEALRLRPRETAPALWGATMNNLAYALRVQGDGTADPGARLGLLGQAAQVCRQALEVAARGSQPDLWAELHSNLGSALLRQAELLSGPERARLAAEAAAACRAALGVLTESAAPFDHRRIQGDLRRAEALLA